MAAVLSYKLLPLSGYLDVSSECVAQYKGEPLRTGGGVVTVHTLTSASIR